MSGINFTVTGVLRGMNYGDDARIRLEGYRGVPGDEKYGFKDQRALTLYLPEWEANKLAGELARVEETFLVRAQLRAERFLEKIKEFLVDA